MKECKCTLAQKVVGDGCSICNPKLMIEMLQEQIQELEATIEAQEIIIKGKSAIMEAMVQPRTCDGCMYYEEEDLYMGYCIEINTDVNNKWGCMSYEPKAQP